MIFEKASLRFFAPCGWVISSLSFKERYRLHPQGYKSIFGLNPEHERGNFLRNGEKQLSKHTTKKTQKMFFLNKNTSLQIIKLTLFQPSVVFRRYSGNIVASLALSLSAVLFPLSRFLNKREG
jgi:hypothetical protein